MTLKMLQRPEKYDAIIIETTGMADPAPVAFTFNSKPEVSDGASASPAACDSLVSRPFFSSVRYCFSGFLSEALAQGSAL